MAGTTSITQTRISYICQSITSTGPGESSLNALETINVKSIAQDAIATIASTGDFYEWHPASVAAPGVGVVIPLGQALATPGRWLQLTSLPPGVLYNQFIEGLPLAATSVPVNGPLVAALQQDTLRFINGNVSDGAGHTDLTLHNQQVFYKSLVGVSTATPQRARLRLESGYVNATMEPLIVTDDPVTDSTVVTVCQTGVSGPPFGVSVLDMGGVPNVYTGAAAAANGLAFARASALAKANGSRAVYIPQGIWLLPEVSTVYITSNTSFIAGNQMGLTITLACSAIVSTLFADGCRVKVVSTSTPADYCEGILTSSGATANVLVDVVAGSVVNAHIDWHISAVGTVTCAIVTADNFTWYGAGWDLTTLVPYSGAAGVAYDAFFSAESIAGNTGVGVYYTTYRAFGMSGYGYAGELINYGIYSPVCYDILSEDVFTTGGILKFGQFIGNGDVLTLIHPRAIGIAGIPLGIGITGTTTNVVLEDCNFSGNDCINIWMNLCMTAQVSGTFSVCGQGGILMTTCQNVDIESIHSESLGGAFSSGIGERPGLIVNGSPHLALLWIGVHPVSTAGPASAWTYYSVVESTGNRCHAIRVSSLNAYGQVPSYSMSATDVNSAYLYLQGVPVAAYPTLRIKIIAGGVGGVATFQYALDGSTYSGTITSLTIGNVLGASGLTVRWDAGNLYTVGNIVTFNVTAIPTSVVAGSNWDGLTVEDVYYPSPSSYNPMVLLATITGANGAVGATAIGYCSPEFIDVQEALEGLPIELSSTTSTARVSAVNSRAAAIQVWKQPLPTYTVGASPYGVMFDGRYIWVANRTDGTVTKIAASDKPIPGNPSLGTVIGTYASGGGAGRSCFDGTYVWVTNYTDATVTKLLASTGAVIGTYATGTNPRGLCFDGTNIWIVNYNGATVTKLLASTGALVGTYAVGTGPWDCCFDGTNVWVTNNNDNTVTKLLASTGGVVGTYATGTNPAGCCFDGTNVWTADAGGATVSKLTASSGALVGSYSVGGNPYFVAFDGTDIWATNAATGVIRVSSVTGTVIARYTAGAGANGIAFDGLDMWVVNSTDATVSRI